MPSEGGTILKSFQRRQEKSEDQVPAAAGQHTSDSRNPHHFTPDDEEAYEHENFFNPDTTPHHDSHSN